LSNNDKPSCCRTSAYNLLAVKRQKLDLRVELEQHSVHSTGDATEAYFGSLF